MANKIIIKKSSVPAKVPVAGDLDVGELAVNLADAKLYTKNAGGTIIELAGGGGGSGDVVGPASATDNALARFDGTTGKLIQNSTVNVDDNGNVINVNSVGLDTTPATVPATVGTMSWDDGEGVPSVLLKGGNVNLEVGAQEYARVYNDSGVALTKGQVVYISGAQGNRVAVKLARANLEATSFGTIGLVAESIGIGAEGFVIVSGALGKLNTTGLTAGATVYLSPTTAGAITTTKPQAPDQLVVLGWVERVDNIVGSIYVKIDNGYELDELHDVQVTSPQSGNLLIYDASTTPIGVWKNAFLTAGTGVSVTNGAGSITIANSGVTSLTGTANEVEVSASTGAVTLSLPATINANTTGSAATLTTGRTISATGDISYTSGSFNGSANVTGTATLATVNANVGSFNYASITVNAKGLVTAASSGTAPVTSVTGTSPVASSGGTTPAISLASGYGDTQNPYASKTANFFLAAPNGTAGAPTFRAIVAADIPTLNQNTTGTASNVTGIVAIANGGTGATTAANALTNLGAYPASNPNGYTSNAGTVTSITAGTGLSGGTITTSGTIALANTAVTAGSYTNASITVDAQGRITAASSGSGGSGTVTSVSGTGSVSGLTLTGTVTTSGSLTLGGNLSITADMIYDVFNATASQTTFTTSQTYTSGKISVYVNGVRMVNGSDVTVTSGTSVVFPTGLPVNTRVDLVYPI